MSSKEPREERNEKIGTNRSAFRGRLKAVVFIFFAGAIFFLCAGRMNMVMAWVYIGVVLVNTVITSQVVDPELIKERAGVKKDVKRWDILPAALVGLIGPVVILIVAGLDVRSEWSQQIPIALRIAALGIVILGLLLIDWAVISNRFFSAVVRIQKDRGHTAVKTGPYKYVRHPGYAGSILYYYLMIPVVLGSLWALIPAGLLVCITIIRTIFEDRTLQDELDGYQSYKKQVRYRLLPKIW